MLDEEQPAAEGVRSRELQEGWAAAKDNAGVSAAEAEQEAVEGQVEGHTQELPKRRRRSSAKVGCMEVQPSALRVARPRC